MIFCCLPGRKFLLMLLPLRYFLQGMLHLYIGSIVLVDMYVFCVLDLSLLLPFWAYLGRSLLLFLALPSPYLWIILGWAISNFFFGIPPPWCVVQVIFK